MSDTLKDRLAKPLNRWQCSDGCRHLAEREPVEGRRRWRCAFFDDFPFPIGVGIHFVEMGDLNEKRVLGPHLDEPTIQCPHFTTHMGDPE